MVKQLILIVEDEAPIRTMLRYALEKHHFVVEEAVDGIEAQRKINQKIPDLILLDWMIPLCDGLTLAKQLKQNPATQNIPIIMVSAKSSEDDKIKGLEVGADDYVVKPFSPRELIARVRAVLRRGPVVKKSCQLSVQELFINTQSQRVTIDGKLIKLGPLEYRLLCFFITHPDRVFSRDELLTHVWGSDVYVDERTVDVHIRRLRKQLSHKNYDGMIQTVHGSGYRFSETCEVGC